MHQASGDEVALHKQLDRRRIRGFVGLILAGLGPRAHSAVAGTFLALIVAERTKSLTLVTLALTGHRIIAWIAYPIAGRISDRSDTPIGRRAPYMAAALFVMAGATALYTRADSYWMLVAMIVIGRLSLIGYRIPSAAATPEVFGGTRWLRAGFALGVGGAVVGLSIRLTVIGTWEQDDPTTWRPAYYMAAGFMVLAGLAALFLVRELPAARRLAHRERAPLLEPLRTVLAAPNAGVLLAGLLLAIAASGAIDRAYPIYAKTVLHAGGSQQAVAGLAGAVLGAVTFPVSWFLAGWLKRRTAGMLAGFVAAAGLFAHLWITELWQSVILLLLIGVFLTACGLSLAPLVLQLFPRRGGLGERLGLVIGPSLLVGMIASYFSGFAYDFVVHDYRVIWVIAGVLALAAGFVMLALRLDPAHQRTDTWAVARRLWALLWGRTRHRRLFHGQVEDHDADGTAFLEIIREALDPYTSEAVSTGTPEAVEPDPATTS